MGCTGTKPIHDKCDKLTSIEEKRQTPTHTKEQKASPNDVKVCPKLNVKLTVLVVCIHVDDQITIVYEAIEKLGCKCLKVVVSHPDTELSLDTEEANSRQLPGLPTLDQISAIDLVIIDRRVRKGSPSNKTSSSSLPKPLLEVHPLDFWCKRLRNVLGIKHAVIMALVERRLAHQQSVEVYQTLLDIGYNKCIYVPLSLSTVHRELATFANNELVLIQRIRQLESTSDAVCQVAADVRIQKVEDNTDPLADELSHSKLTSIVSDVITNQVKEAEIALPDGEAGESSLDRSLSGSHPVGSFNRDVFEKFLMLTKRESITRLQNLNVTSPLCRALNILNSLKNRPTSDTSRDLQKAINLICTSDVFIAQVLKPTVNHINDPLTADLVEGLMTNVVNNSDGVRTSKSIPVIHDLKLKSESIDDISLKVHSKEIEACLVDYDQWNYNILTLETVTRKRPMIPLAMKILKSFNAVHLLRISETTMYNWLAVIEENYRASNPYHNSTHAADVMQSTAYLLRIDAISAIMENVDEVAAVLAAVIHDLNHPGRNNPFLVNSNDRLAMLYNDIAVLESHHVALAFELTHKSCECNIFQNLSRDDYRTIRRYMIDMVLATEMARHFDHVTKFIGTVSKPILQRIQNHGSGGSTSSTDSTSLRLSNPCASLPKDSYSQLSDEETLSSSEHIWSPEQREIVRRLIIKCSDVNNPTRPLTICKEWAYRIAEEYFSQTDEEKRLGLPIVMPNFDRQTCNIAKSQISFIDFFLKDMFVTFDSVFPIPELLHNLNDNYQYWAQVSESTSTG